jgi:hypothetical protein
VRLFVVIEVESDLDAHPSMSLLPHTSPLGRHAPISPYTSSASISFSPAVTLTSVLSISYDDVHSLAGPSNHDGHCA